MNITTLLRTSLLIILSLLCLKSNAQDVYLSISGKDSRFLSGDDRHQYDIWIKPESGAKKSTLQIYDAGLGGAVDLITNRSATVTTFRVFPFDDRYELTSDGISEKNSTSSALTELVTQAEERYKNRWVDLTELSPSTPNGYLIRVTAGEGADVNNFNFRVVSDNGNIVSGNSWNIITVDLSIGFYRSTPQNFFQLRPYDPAGTRNADLVVSGEEDSRVQKIDAFGNVFPLQGAQIPENRFGIQNNWGLNMSGSNELINNFTIFGSEKPVLWIFDPILVTDQSKPFANINESSTSRCTDLAFTLQSNAFQSEALQATRWLVNNNEIATGRQPLISFNTRGNVDLNVLVPNQNSYFPEYWAYEKKVFVNTPPVARLTVPKEIISPSERVTLSAEGSYDLEGQELSYTWFVNGTPRGNGKEFEFSNTISGSYVVSVRVSDGGTTQACSNSQRQSRIRINTQPYAEIEYTELFGTGDQVIFSVSNASDADNDQLFYEWTGTGIVENNFGDSVTISHDTPGIYEVALTVNDSTESTNSDFTVTRQYEVNAAPDLAFTSPEKVAPGDEIILDASSTTDQNDSTLDYQWYVDGQEIDGGPVVSLTLEDPKIYDVRLVVNDGRNVSNSVQELSKTLRVNDAPRPVIISPEITSSSLVNIKAENFEQITQYEWDFGDGNTDVGPNVEHMYQKPGTYTLTLKVDDGEGLGNSIQTTQKELVVNKFPEARFEAPAVVAPGQSFTADGTMSLDEDGMVETYEWYVDGIPAGSGERPSLVIGQPGEHMISLRVKDNSGFDIAQGLTSRSIRVNNAPVPKWVSIPDTPVPGEEITFSAEPSFDKDGSIINYTWTFEDGQTMEGVSIQRSFEESGTKNFTLSVTDNDGLENSTSTIEESIHLNHQPYIVTEPAIRSNSLDITLDASGSYDLDEDPLHFEWTLPDGSKRYESSFSWKAPEPGVHIVSLQINDGQGLANSQNEELIRVLINRPVKAVVDSMIASCTGQTVLFNSSRSYDPDGDAFQVNWDFGNGESSDQANPSYSYEEPGVYEAKLSLNDGFTDEQTIAKIPVIIEGSPIARMNIADTTICVNSAIEFDGSASSDPSGSLPSFAWDLGDGNSETGPKVRHVFTEPGEYVVSLTVEGSGSGMCSNISQVTGKVRVIEGPEANFEIPAWAAPGEEITLDGSASIADGGFKNVEWLIENEDTTYVETGLQTSHVFRSPGEYFVTLNLETNTSTSCNTVSLTKTIKVNGEPEINWSLPENIAAGTDLKLDASASTDAGGFIKKYRWFHNDSLISNNVSEIIKAVEPGIHTFALEITDNSAATNNTIRAERSLFANSAPKPRVEMPRQRYLHQEISMATLSTTDNDGDELTSKWYLDGKEIANPVFTPHQLRKYRVVLIQNDGRGLSNSIDSAIVEYIPKRLPEANPALPGVLAVGAKLSRDQLNLTSGWQIVHNNTYSDTWNADTTGTDSLRLAWVFEEQELTRSAFAIQVAEQLKFNGSPEPETLPWNPANPTTILEAPRVNRELGKVRYTWLQNEEIIGEGLQQEVQLEKGENRFTIRVQDLQVEQSSPVETEMIIITE